MAQGTVKWFTDAKGYGFITQKGGEGDKVEFDVTKGPEAFQASNVRTV